jgi:hypothetical protein
MAHFAWGSIRMWRRGPPHPFPSHPGGGKRACFCQPTRTVNLPPGAAAPLPVKTIVPLPSCELRQCMPCASYFSHVRSAVGRGTGRHGGIVIPMNSEAATFSPQLTVAQPVS